VSRAHGVHGEVRILPSSDNPERFAPTSVLYARPERLGLAGPRLHEQTRLIIAGVRGEDAFPIVKFEGVDDRDAAEALRGWLLEVPSGELPELEEGEFYPFDIIGLEVRDESGVAVGRVTDILESPAHPLLVVSAGGEGGDCEEETLVPFVLEAVPTVAESQGYLVVAASFLGSAEHG